MSKRLMRLFSAILAAGLGAGALSGPLLGQTSRVRRELEVMEQILETSLAHANEAQDGVTPFLSGPGAESFESYYLPGQGALFLVSLASSGHLFNFGGFPLMDMKMELSDLEHVDARILKSMERGMASVAQLDGLKAQLRSGEALLTHSQGQDDPPVPPAPPAPPVPAHPPEPPNPPVPPAYAPVVPQLWNTEDFKANLESRRKAMQARIEQRKQELERHKASLDERMNDVEAELIEILARYGDTLSVVQPQERITIIVHESGHRFGDRSRQARSLSVARSSVMDLKAGRLSRVEFEDKVARARHD